MSLLKIGAGALLGLVALHQMDSRDIAVGLRFPNNYVALQSCGQDRQRPGEIVCEHGRSLEDVVRDMIIYP